MKFNSLLRKGVLFAGLAMSLLPAGAAAAGDEVGKFSLSTNIHWGDVILSPGEYRILTRGHESSTTMYIMKMGNPTTSFFVTAVECDVIPTTLERTQLVLGDKDGVTYVKELMLGSEGIDLHYAAPKLKKADRL